MKTSLRILIVILVLWPLIVVDPVFGQSGETTLKRSRGEGLFDCASATTIGRGNISLTTRAIGFIWDNVDTLSHGGKGASLFSNIRGFPEVSFEWGLFDFLSLYGESRIVTFSFAPGYFTGGVKATLPNTKELRLNGAGIALAYRYKPPEGPPGIGSFRTDDFKIGPEGLLIYGSSVEGKALYELDLIRKISWLPIKFMADLGLRLPLNTAYLNYSQYLFSAGIEWTGVESDFFVEYSLEGLVNKNMTPKKFNFTMLGHHSPDAWEIAFSENPMYVTPGARVRYPSGITIFGCVPLLLSTNSGSDMSTRNVDSRVWLPQFPDEQARGITASFEPWYIKWKIVGGITFPLRFRQTSMEMIRNFTLLKNKKSAKRIDIDERLKALESTVPQDSAQIQRQDAQKRLDEINKQREQIQKESK
ncbi:MAG: hypothetical protein PHC61_15810 [Chitinivibrionales bacterium]|nr:hypothetical protein [Chitinivibrionales bacterium]